MYQRLALILSPWLFLLLYLASFEYGTDVDSWYLAQNSQWISMSGTYIMSRPPGFPLYELILSLLIPSGAYYLSNAFSLLGALVLALLFYYQIREEKLSLPYWAIVSLISFPLLIIGGSSTLDYLPGLAILWGAYVCLYKAGQSEFNSRSFYLSACFIGLASGFRLTALGFLPAALIFLWAKKGSWKSGFVFTLLCLLSTLLAYLPVFLGPGFSLPLGQSVLSWSYHLQVAAYHALVFWGVLPAMIFLLGLLLVLFNSEIRQKLSSKHRASDLFHLTVLGLYVSFFLLLPDESSYLLPILPSSLILIHRYYSPKLIVAFCLCIFSSNFIQLELKGGESGKRVFDPHWTLGKTWQDWKQRQYIPRFREAVENFYPEEKTLLMMEIPWVQAVNPAWQYDQEENHYKKEGSLFYFGPYIFDPEDLKRKKAAGYKIYVSREQKWEYYAMGLENLLASDIEIIDINEFLQISQEE